MPNIAIAILAAGSSSRMGQPKQLLLYQGKSLLHHAIAVASSTSCRPIFVVLQNLEHLERSNAVQGFGLPSECQALLNSDTKQGISSSIRVAVEKAVGDHTIDGVLFMNCDQPQIESTDLNNLVSNYKSGAIVASSFGGTLGSPAIFDREFFSELLALEGDRGAKTVIVRNVSAVLEVPMEKARFDIDTPADYAALG